MRYDVTYINHIPGEDLDGSYITIPMGEKNTACFTSLRHNSIHVIEYNCAIRKASHLTEPEIDRYVEFLSWMFSPVWDRVTFSYVYAEDKLTGIDWWIDARGWTYHKTLLLLTAMRYLDEYGSYVEVIAKHKTSDELEMFRDLQKAEIEHGGDGHTMIYRAYTYRPISIEDFHANLAKGRDMVQSFFEAITPAKPEEQEEEQAEQVDNDVF